MAFFRYLMCKFKMFGYITWNFYVAYWLFHVIHCCHPPSAIDIRRCPCHPLSYVVVVRCHRPPPYHRCPLSSFAVVVCRSRCHRCLLPLSFTAVVRRCCLSPLTSSVICHCHPSPPSTAAVAVHRPPQKFLCELSSNIAKMSNNCTWVFMENRFYGDELTMWLGDRVFRVTVWHTYSVWRVDFLEYL